MSQTIFDTRQRADELLQEAIAIWRQSNYSDHLEGLENDPVFAILMAAVAWQANETDNEIARIKDDVLEEYAQALVPYEAAHASPATTTIEVGTAPDVAEVELDHHSTFTLGEDGYRFVPVFRSRVINMRVADVQRLDGRRWAVHLESDFPIHDLSLLTFSIEAGDFRDVAFKVGDREIPVVRPWEYSELPYTEPFLLDNALYSRRPYYNPASAILDLFAHENIRTFVVRHHEASQIIPSPSHRLTIEMEFTGIATDFRFNASMLHLNTVLLANAYVESTVLDTKMPISRVAGDEGAGGTGSGQLMHLIRPAEEQIYADIPIRIRRVQADRFNQSALLRLLSSLIDKLQTDYYAFQYLRLPHGASTLYHLRTYLQKLADATSQNDSRRIGGTYLIAEGLRKMSVTVSYVMTNGAAVNAALRTRARFNLPSGLASSSSYIGSVGEGSDEMDRRCAEEMVRYHIITADRIVTMADIRAFCINQLLQSYSITRSMVADIRIAPHLTDRPQRQRNACGYEIKTVITITETPFVRRSFIGKIAQAEILLEKMMAVRSANIYPITVKIEVK